MVGLSALQALCALHLQGYHWLKDVLPELSAMLSALGNLRALVRAPPKHVCRSWVCWPFVPKCRPCTMTATCEPRL